MLIAARLTNSPAADVAIWFLIGAFAFVIASNIVAGAVTFFRISYRHKPFAFIDSDKIMGKDFKKRLEFAKPEIEKLKALPHGKETVAAYDGISLFGEFYPSGNSKKTVLCLHGYGTDGYTDFAPISSFYLNNGYNLLIPDLRAHGKSGGRLIGLGVLDRRDVMRWIEFLNVKFPTGEIIVHGVSVGAVAALTASGIPFPENVKAVIADSAYTTPWAVFSLVFRTIYKLPSFPALNMAELITKIFGKFDYRTISAPGGAARSKTPTLFIHGSADIFVPAVMGKISFDACAARKEMLIVDGAGHGGAYFKDREGVEKAIVNFIKG
jgi:hypothetical protein